jgi:hypothetical protein
MAGFLGDVQAQSWVLGMVFPRKHMNKMVATVFTNMAGL